MCDISVVIPTLNEVATLPCLLSDLRAQTGVRLEIIVADGGSSDGTTNLDGFRLVSCPRPHRGEQLNTGARLASAPWLVFLHADSRLTEVTQLRDALAVLAASAEPAAGHFKLRFVGPTSEQPAFRYLEAKSRLNRPNTTNGDQGMMVSRSLFESLGGFDTRLPFLEDQRFAETLRRHARWITLPGTLETSTRRFATEGFAARYFAMAVMMGAHETQRPELLTAWLYRPQPTGALELDALLDAIQTLENDPDTAADLWLAVGTFARRNLWQVALAANLLRGARDDHPPHEPDMSWLAEFDRFVAPRLDHPFVDAGIGTGLAAIFLLALPTVWAAKQRILRAQP